MTENEIAILIGALACGLAVGGATVGVIVNQVMAGKIAELKKPTAFSIESTFDYDVGPFVATVWRTESRLADAYGNDDIVQALRTMNRDNVTQDQVVQMVLKFDKVSQIRVVKKECRRGVEYLV